MTEEERKNMLFKLKYLSKPEVAAELSDSDLDWTIRMEAAYLLRHNLSPKQMKIIDDLWDKAQ